MGTTLKNMKNQMNLFLCAKRLWKMLVNIVKAGNGADAEVEDEREPEPKRRKRNPDMGNLFSLILVDIYSIPRKNRKT